MVARPAPTYDRGVQASAEDRRREGQLLATLTSRDAVNTASTLSAADRAELAAYEERALSPEAFAARVAAPWTAQEIEDFDALCAWFRRRYPTPWLRLQATRHLASQWPRCRGVRAAITGDAPVVLWDTRAVADLVWMWWVLDTPMIHSRRWEAQVGPVDG